MFLFARFATTTPALRRGRHERCPSRADCCAVGIPALFQWKDQVISLALFLLVSAVWAGAALLVGASGTTVTIALAGIEMPSGEGGRFGFEAASPDARAQVEALNEVISRACCRAGRTEPSICSLVKDPRYRADLSAVLQEVVRRERLAASGVAPEVLKSIRASSSRNGSPTPSGSARGGARSIAAGARIGVLLIGVFTSLSLLLTASRVRNSCA